MATCNDNFHAWKGCHDDVHQSFYVHILKQWAIQRSFGDILFVAMFATRMASISWTHFAST